MQDFKNSYYAVLINDQGCQFDSCDFNSLKSLKTWANGRGGNYKCKIYINDNPDDYEIYNIINNRFITTELN